MKNGVILIFFLVLFFNFCFAQQNEVYIIQKIQNYQNISFTNFNKAVTASVYPITIAAPISIFAFSTIKKDSILFRKSLVISGTILIAGTISTVLKYSVQRKRPYVSFPNQVIQLSASGPYSFPSGHTTFAFSTATSLSLQYKKWYVAIPAYLWASSVGYSRIYLGVHYPSDVATGVFTGVGSALLCNYLNKKIFKY